MELIGRDLLSSIFYSNIIYFIVDASLTQFILEIVLVVHLFGSHTVVCTSPQFPENLTSLNVRVGCHFCVLYNLSIDLVSSLNIRHIWILGCYGFQYFIYMHTCTTCMYQLIYNNCICLSEQKYCIILALIKIEINSMTNQI